MLRALPGVNEKIVTMLTLEVESMMELANMEERDLCKLIGTDVGRRLYRFFNHSVYGDSTVPTF